MKSSAIIDREELQQELPSLQFESETKIAMTCLILCGGQSKRMGRPKEFLPLNGKTMVETILDRAQATFSEVLLVTNKPDDFEHLSADLVKDIVPNRGPLVAILSGLLVSEFDDCLVMPADMPLFSEKSMEMIALAHRPENITLYAANGFDAKLPGVFNKNLIPALEDAIFNGRDSLDDFIKEQSPRHCDGDKFQRSGLPFHFDVNSLKDYSLLCL